jgi:hypothetical protein
VKRTALFVLAFILAAGAAWCQGPVFRQKDLWTLPYEDLSDLLRRYPGMYPLDYGNVGQPLLFRPWNLNPWELRVDRDGIPQNRVSDGLYDPNLQPGIELDSIRYDYLRDGGAGRFDLATRTFQSDTPYTEVHIREGFYGYGTVDFAQGERIHKSLTLEVTGRLLFYNGLRSLPNNPGRNDSSRDRWVRGRVGFDLGPRWRSYITYAGSVVNSLTPLSPRQFYLERHEGILTVAQKDSARTAFDPSLKLYARQDREKWGNPFQQRELTRGAILEAHATLPDQRFTFRQLSTLSTINFPGFAKRDELWLELHAADSIGLAVGGVTVFGNVRRESNTGLGIPKQNDVVSGIGARFESVPMSDFVLHGGTQWTEELAPLAWRFGSYTLSDRPLLAAPEFGDVSLRYVPYTDTTARATDRYWKSDLGVRWDLSGGYVDVTAMRLSHPGHLRNVFSLSNDQFHNIYLAPTFVSRDTAQVGVSVATSIPLKWGLRLEGWGFGQAAANDLGNLVDSRGYARLYFEHAFFSTPLIIRAHVSDEFFGQRVAYSELGQAVLGPNSSMGIRISATIRGVTAIWGTENFLNQPYYILPGYKMIGKEEYLGFMIRLWL